MIRARSAFLRSGFFACAVALFVLAFGSTAATAARHRTQGPSRLIETTLPERDLFPGSLTQGPDGNMWFALVKADPGYGSLDPFESVMVRMTLSGDLTEFPLPHPAGSLVSGPGDDIWFLNRDGIGRITMAGQVTEYPAPTGIERQLVAGPDGNLWFTRREDSGYDAIVRFTPTGQVTEFPLPREVGAHGITVGPDGNLWFTEMFGERVGRITPKGHISEYPVSGRPQAIAAGPDGNLWFTLDENIGRIRPDGVSLNTFEVGESGSPQYNGPLIAGPDGRAWLGWGADALIRVASNGGTSPLALRSSSRSLVDIATGPEGEVWFTALGEPPCEGGGLTCASRWTFKPGVVGRITPEPLRFAILASGSSVHRRWAVLRIACRSGDATDVCHGAIGLRAGRRVLARHRIGLKTDEVRTVVLSFGRGPKSGAALEKGRSVVVTATIRDRQRTSRAFTVR